VVDPASNWPLFAEKARELITKEKVAVVFGCWTSVSRKSVLPVFKELDSILFYPVQYEGEESERNVFYTGAAPNHQAIPAVDYLMSKDGGEAKSIYLTRRRCSGIVVIRLGELAKLTMTVRYGDPFPRSRFELCTMRGASNTQ
jgi:Periplasmic binding protein domain